MDVPRRMHPDYLSPHVNTRRSRRLTSPSPSRDADLFLDLAKDSSNAPREASSHSVARTRISNAPIDSTTARSDIGISRTMSASNALPSTFKSSHTLYEARNIRTSPATDTRRGETNISSMRPFRPSYKPSTLSSVFHDNSKSSDLAYSPSWTNAHSPISPPCTDGVESVGSVTAISTIWDDAEDLKGRIDKYRASGRRITSSGGANLDESGDRPRTATTMTTNSSSHAQQALNKVMPSRVDSSGNKTHELLRTALSKAKVRVEASVYQALETCASDAISASAMLELVNGVGGQFDDVAKSPVDKRMKRRVDGVCRGLTELCIALMQEGHHNGTRLLESRVESRQTERPASRISAIAQSDFSPSTYLEERRARIDRITSGSRPESSLSRQPPRSGQSSQQWSGTRQPTSLTKARPRRLSLMGTSVEPSDSRSSHRTSTILSGGDSEDRDSTVRAPSMAATDIAPSQLSPLSPRRRQKFSRDYTDQSPLPEDLSPSLRQSLTTYPSHASLRSSYSTMTQDSPYRPRNGYTRSTRAPSNLLEQRLEQRRQQQNVASSNQLGSITGLPNDYSSPRASSAAPSRRPQSSGHVSSRPFQR